MLLPRETSPSHTMSSSPTEDASTEVPRHVAIIMDGNGRWAEDRGLERLEGHKRGADVVRDISTYARELGIRYVTLYSFSRQNWRRPPHEVAGLMHLLESYCEGERELMLRNEIRLTRIGESRRMPESTRQAVELLSAATQHCKKMTLCLALDYGGREEIVTAIKRFVASSEKGILEADQVNEAEFEKHLDTAKMPDPDLLIRTSGERRVSNFLLWQLAYAELYFTDAYWPDFTRAHFLAALRDYAQRQRRYGQTAAQLRECAPAKSYADVPAHGLCQKRSGHQSSSPDSHLL